MQVSTISTMELPVKDAKTRQNMSKITWKLFKMDKKWKNQIEKYFLRFWIFKNWNFIILTIEIITPAVVIKPLESSVLNEKTL